MNGNPFQLALADAINPEMSDAEFNAKYPWPDSQHETVSLAMESARRWARRTDLSPELRLRRIWTVLTTALEA